MKYKPIILFIAVLLIVNVYAIEPDYTIPVSQNSNITIQCLDEVDDLCSQEVNCYFTSLDRTGQTIISNQSMTYSNEFFYYTLNTTDTATKGDYLALVHCAGNQTATSRFYYRVNPSGLTSDDIGNKNFMLAIGFFLIIGTLFSFGAMTTKKLPFKLTYITIGFVFFLIAINLLFVSIQDQVINSNLETFIDGFTAISYIIYWGAGSGLFILWMFTFLNTWLYKKNMARMEKFGGADVYGKV